MEKGNCCIAIFADFDDANIAFHSLLAMKVAKEHISLIGEKVQLGRIATESLDDLDNDLIQLGVQKATLYCYKCLLYSDFYLLIVNGNYQEVEYACHHLEHYDQADVAIHFNAL